MGMLSPQVVRIMNHLPAATPHVHYFKTFALDLAWGPPPWTESQSSQNPYGGMSYLEALVVLNMPVPLAADSQDGMEAMEAIENDIRRDALFEKYILDGVSYHEARMKAGLSRDVNPRFSGGETVIVENIKAQARFEQLIVTGVSYQEARRQSGMARDIDSARSDGHSAIEQRIRQHGTLRRLMLYGEDRSKWLH